MYIQYIYSLPVRQSGCNSCRLQEKTFHNCYTYKIAHTCNAIANTTLLPNPEALKDSRSLESQRSLRPHAQ